MGIIALTGRDSHVVNGRILNDFASGDCVKIEYETELTVVKKGKNGNTIYALNESGKMAKATYRILSGGADDSFFNSLMQAYLNDPAAFTLLTGQSQKRLGDGAGNIHPVTYAMTGGVIKKYPGMDENADGNTDQAIVTWEISFGNAQRSIG